MIIRSALFVSLVACALSALTTGASAQHVEHSQTFGPVPIGGSTNVTLPRYDGSQGPLQLVRITVFGRVSGTWAFENTSAQSAWVGGYASGQWIGAIVPVSLPVGGMAGPNPGFVGDAIQLATFDGAVDFGGASGVSVPFTDQSGDGAPTQEANIYTDSGRAYYAAPGTFDVALGPMLRYGPAQLPAGVQDGSLVTVSGIVTVRYTYAAPTTEICRAESSSGCPCGNTGSYPRGCDNSTGGGGGLLAATGSASLSNDTLALVGSGMTNSNALYFQGTSFLYAQSVYGDGLRCVTGTVVRLGTKTNSGGVSGYPALGDTPISVRGGVAAPGTRMYQVIYRDGGSFCTPSLFNATNGLYVLWQP